MTTREPTEQEVEAVARAICRNVIHEAWTDAVVDEMWGRYKKAARAAISAMPSGSRDDRQATISAWAAATFGSEQQSSVPQRALRLLEEAIEVYQAAGCDEDMAQKLVSFVFSRPAGTVAQELGGVGICVLLLAAAHGSSADDAEAAEVARVKSKSLAHFAARNQAKNDAGFLALPSPPESTP